MGLAASMAKDMPEEKMPHMTASSSPFFNVKFPDFRAQRNFFAMPGNRHDDKCHKALRQCQKREKAAGVWSLFAACPWTRGGIFNVPTNQGDTDGHTDAEDMPR